MMRSQDKESPSRMVAYLAVMTAVAAVLGYLEMLIPVNIFGIPGVKTGFANIVSLIVLYGAGPAYSYPVMTARVILIGFMFGNMYSILYSLAGGLLSITVMFLFKRTGLFTMTGVSAAGGAAHNTGQLIVAVIMLDGINMLYYIPVLVISGLICGCITGIIAGLLFDRLKGTGFLYLKKEGCK